MRAFPMSFASPSPELIVSGPAGAKLEALDALHQHGFDVYSCQAAEPRWRVKTSETARLARVLEPLGWRIEGAADA